MVSGWSTNSLTYRRISLRLIVREHEIGSWSVPWGTRQRGKRNSSSSSNTASRRGPHVDVDHRRCRCHCRRSYDVADLWRGFAKGSVVLSTETRRPGTLLRCCKTRFLFLFFFLPLSSCLSLPTSLSLSISVFLSGFVCSLYYSYVNVY